MIIGYHMSTTKGFEKTVKHAIKYGANTFQFFPRNPRGAKAREIDYEDAKMFKDIVKEKNFGPVIAHGAYTMNLCSDKEDIRNLAKVLIKDDLDRLKVYGIDRYVFHPGSHVKQGADKGLNIIVDALNEILVDEEDIKIGLETMSGKGTEIGRNLDEIKYIIDNVHYKNLGVCLDTCHLYSSGYDIVNNLEEFVSELDEKIGLDKVYAIHINDSMKEFSSNKDRHAKIGEGTIGLNAIARFINHPAFINIPMSLETPNDDEGYMKEIITLKNWKE